MESSGVLRWAGLVLTGVLLCAPLSGCSDSTAESTAFLPPSRGLPSVPADDHGTAAISGVVDRFTPGSRALRSSDGAQVRGTTLTLSSRRGAAQWAMYKCGSQDAQPESVLIELTRIGGGNIWVAVANYSTGSWDYCGPFPDARPGRIDFARRHLDRGGSACFMVLAFDGSKVRVDGSTVRLRSAEGAAATRPAPRVF